VGKSDAVVGWYHSHPGFGCWLSGIDVNTQFNNQNFQDPYLSIGILISAFFVPFSNFPLFQFYREFYLRIFFF
jgi:proteasome lid subunit RPN8/RPN11